jgi:uncharacterized protein with HEPN domain
MKDDLVYIRHIMDAIVKIERYVSAGRDQYLAESMRHDAVMRELEIVGEATKQLSTGFRESHSHVPWRDIAGLRDVICHDYMGIELDVVWEITQKNLPTLKQQIQSILDDMNEGE